MATTQTGCAAAPPDGAGQAADEPARPILPVATRREVRAYARRLMLQHPGRLATALTLHGVAATAGLISPRLIGNLVQEVGGGQLTALHVDLVALTIGGLIMSQAVILRFAVFSSTRLGEMVLGAVARGVRPPGTRAAAFHGGTGRKR